jgi:signal transduction histidine kinase
MSIRTRLVLCFLAMLVFGLLLIAGWAYFELFIENRVDELEAGLAAQGNSLLEEIGEVLLFAVLPAMVLTGLGGWFLLNRTVEPILALSRAVERVHLGNFSEQLPRTGTGDEVDRLTEVFNSMLRRLDESFNRVKDFTLHASHELKTPLAVLRGEVETALREGSVNEEQQRLFAGQLDEIERLTKIVDGLTLLARVDSSQLKLDWQCVRLDELVRECHEDMRVLAFETNITVESTVCDKIQVRADRHRMRQLLLILADNALKYNQPGGLICLMLTQRERWVEFCMSNTGPGIPQEEMGRLFDRFYRGRRNATEKADGCGLGLCIGQSIVKAHGGSITAESTPGQLTRFIVRLPLPS